nr:hypothetical protein B0A51_02561 [Rachicladosporium sp. CCFEE 5018]
MSTTAPPTRLDSALSSLLSRLIPDRLPHETQEQADARWEAANDRARSLINSAADAEADEGSDGRWEDVEFVAEELRRRLRDEGNDDGSGDGEEGARRLGGLVERLQAQKVLGRKGGILWFLGRVAEDMRREEKRDEEDDREAGEGRFVGVPRSRGMESPRTRPVGDRATGLRPQEAAMGAEQKDDRESGASGRSDRPTEAALMGNLPFTLQGLSSTNMVFEDDVSLKLPPTLPVPMIALLHALAEPALLYRSLAKFAEKSETGGLVSQSLQSAIGMELRSYLTLVAQLEGQIRRALQSVDEHAPRGGLGKTGVTLKRLVVWTRDATIALRLMSLIVESSSGKKGGELISCIHDYATSHGDPFVHTFAERLLGNITKPFYSMLRRWVYDGELEDPYQEFFVHENSDNEDGMGPGASSVWEHKYAMKPAMVPSIMTPDFANRVFLIGKSLNFIRYSCGDSPWVESHSLTSSRELSYGDTATLSSSIDTAYTAVMARLLSLMETKFALFTHLTALKKYLLLGQGDFIALLMESLADNLDQPANSQYRHTLTAQLEHAIRNSNAQHDNADVLRRLDARMLELSHGEIGWDVFTLEYRIDSPLDVIVTPWASKQYLKVFNFLWRVKRVEFALGTTWRKCMTGARGVLAAVDDKLGADWKLARGAMAEMIHFVDQLQWYILFEVIEAGWEGLQKSIRKPDATLDTLISAHTAYLKSITRKGLLGGGAIDFPTQLHELLKLMLSYKEAVDALWSISIDEFGRRQERAAKIETRTKAGRWGLTEADDDTPFLSTRSPIPALLAIGNSKPLDEHAVLETLRQRLRELRGEFRAKITVLLGDLRDQPDTDMRFLGVVMNFNDVYQPARRRRAAGGKAKG